MKRAIFRYPIRSQGNSGLLSRLAHSPGYSTQQTDPHAVPDAGIAEHDGYLLLLVGEQDSLIPASQREAIARELRATNVRHEVVIYPDTPHRFFYEEGESYRQVAAGDAWRRVREVLAAELA